MQNIQGIVTSLLPFVILFAIFYFLLIRPNKKRALEHQNMITALKRGDKVLTTGGFIVEIFKVEEKFFSVKLNDDVIVKLAKEYISQKVQDDTPVK